MRRGLRLLRVPQVASGRSVKVHWNDWTAETFARAQREDKVVLLSLSATWCSGCRVMDRTTFADEEVAGLINEHFIPVRVDSDRRPDINDRYNMGGWPSTVFLTPDGNIIWGATYIPPNDMRQLLLQFKTGYQRYKQKILEEIRARDEKTRKFEIAVTRGKAELNIELFRRTVNGIILTFDPVYGGFGRAPKFPMVASTEVMMQAFYETGGEDFLQVIVKTLDAMGDLGIYDHDEGGFFRYAAEENWSAPHYEKILEDNAHLVRLYLDASVLLNMQRYRDKAKHALSYLMRHLADHERGVFYASQAADEDYYTLPPEQRRARPSPPIDRTVFCNWNAEMAQTLLKAWAVLGDESYRDLALRCIRFLASTMWMGDTVYHAFDQKPAEGGLLRDYVGLLRALLAAFEATGEADWLQRAETLASLMGRLFWSPIDQGLVDRIPGPDDVGELKDVRKDIVENAWASDCLARVSVYTGKGEFRERAVQIMSGFPDYLGQYGHFTAQYALCLDRLIRPPVEIDLVLDRSTASEAMKRTALAAYLPRRIVRHLTRDSAVSRGHDGSRVPAAYVCVNGTCQPPALTPEELIQRLDALH